MPSCGPTTGPARLLSEADTVDSRQATGELPTRIAGDPGNAQFGDFPVLSLGESVTVRGYTITVTGEAGDTYTIVVSASTTDDP